MESQPINTAELLQAALESAGMGSWELYLSTGAVHRTPRHDQIFGYSEIQPFWDLEMTLEHIVDEDRAAVRQAFSQAELTARGLPAAKPDGCTCAAEHFMSTRCRRAS